MKQRLSKRGGSSEWWCFVVQHQPAMIHCPWSPLLQYVTYRCLMWSRDPELGTAGMTSGLCACLTSVRWEEHWWDSQLFPPPPPSNLPPCLWGHQPGRRLTHEGCRSVSELGGTHFCFAPSVRAPESPLQLATLRQKKKKKKINRIGGETRSLPFYVSRREPLLHPALIGRAGSLLPGNHPAVYGASLTDSC